MIAVADEAPVAAVPPLDDALRALHAWTRDDPAVVSGRGVEALVAGATLAVSKRTWLLPGRRERGCALLRGCAADRLDAARPYRVVPPGASPAARALQGVGMALGGDSALVFLGTGSTGYGSFLEALNLAGLTRAPVMFLVAWYRNDGPFARQLAASPAEVARGFGLPVATADGADASAVHAAVASLGGRGLVEAGLVGRA